MIDTTGGVVSGGGLPVTGQVRLVAVDLAPSFFTTVVVDGNEMREYVEHLPPGTSVPDGILADGGALQIATLLNVDSELKKLALLLGAVAFAGVVLAVALGWLVARTALVPLNSLTDTVEDLAETTDVTRRLSPGRPDELGRLRRTFNRLLEALESSRRAQSQLVLDASHELRTPLTSLRTNLEVIRRVEELSAEDRSVLVDDVLVQLQELTDIVGDLAELARGDRGPASREPLRLDLLVQDEVAVQNTHGRAQDVHFELDASPCWVVGSDDGLRRAVGNLLDNARKWSPPGEAVEVECHEGTVVVRDHGPGVAEADLPQIFDRFYRSPRGPWPAGVGPGPGHRGAGRQGRRGDDRGRERPPGRGPHDDAPAHGGGDGRAPRRSRDRRCRRDRSGAGDRHRARAQRQPLRHRPGPAGARFFARSYEAPTCRQGAKRRLVRQHPRWRGVPLPPWRGVPSRRRRRRWGRSAAVPAGASIFVSCASGARNLGPARSAPPIRRGRACVPERLTTLFIVFEEARRVSRGHRNR